MIQNDILPWHSDIVWFVSYVKTFYHQLGYISSAIQYTMHWSLAIVLLYNKTALNSVCFISCHRKINIWIRAWLRCNHHWTMWPVCVAFYLSTRTRINYQHYKYTRFIAITLARKHTLKDWPIGQCLRTKEFSIRRRIIDHPMVITLISICARLWINARRQETRYLCGGCLIHLLPKASHHQVSTLGASYNERR